MIHQELALANHLTVAQNVYMGREPRGRLSFMVDDKQQTKQTEELVERLGLKLDPTAKCGDLKVAQQQMVEIAKALSLDAIGAHHGRAHGRADRHRDRGALPHHPLATRAGEGHRPHLLIGSRSCGRSPTA